MYNEQHLTISTYTDWCPTHTHTQRKRTQLVFIRPSQPRDSRAGGQNSVGVPDQVCAAWPTTACVGPVVCGSLDGG